MPFDLRPAAWWAIDTHMDFAWCKNKSQGFDNAFTAQRDGAEELRRAGITSAVWLPLGCSSKGRTRRQKPHLRPWSIMIPPTHLRTTT